jgi:hypothetical protein
MLERASQTNSAEQPERNPTMMKMKRGANHPDLTCSGTYK